MTQTLGHDLDALREAMTGPVVGPDSSDYDEVRRVWNADIDRHPAVIARCACAADVAAALRYATQHGLEVAVRGGAHSMSGASTVDDGLVVDLSLLNQVTVDPVAKRARVGGGALLSDLDAATQEHGLAAPAGVVSHTGVGGLTLGGGMGWLTRRAGLSIDNLVATEVVTADGRTLRAAADSHPDLFWALRGGGGNFGVVTEFEFRLHEVGPIVHFGLLFWELEQGPDVLRLARAVVPTVPRSMNVLIAALNAPPEEFVPEQHRLRAGYALVVVGFESAEGHAELLARLRDGVPPLFEFAGPMPYVALQGMLDEANGWGMHNYEKSAYLEDLTDDAIAVITERVPAKNSPLSVTLFYRLDEAYSEVAEDATAFAGGRSPRYSVFIVAACPTAELLVADRAWARSFWDALRPVSMGSAGYVNAMGEGDEDRVRLSYGDAKLDRLARIKADYDPGNVLHRNVNIKPA